MRILIVDDYKKINDLLASILKQSGYTIYQAFDAKEALDILSNTAIDVVVLDLMLPDLPGERVIQDIRKISDIYIMVISAKVDVANRIDVITLGADDYITKPFSVAEVVAKLKNVEKRLQVKTPTRYSFNGGQLMLFPLSKEVLVNQQSVSLTKYEFDILFHLASHSSQIFTREMIIEYCFEHSEAYDRVIDSFIKNIRRKIDMTTLVPSYIKTHYGVGYQFVGQKDD